LFWGEGVLKELVKGTSIGILLAFFFTALPASSSYAFTLMSNAGRPAYWPHGDVHYRFNTATNGYFSGGHDHSGTATDEFTPIRTAFAAWSNLPGVALNIVENSTTSSGPSTGDGSNTIKWIRTGWRNLSFRPPSNALAVTLLSFSSSTGYIVDADIYFNAENFQWAVVDNASESGYKWGEYPPNETQYKLMVLSGGRLAVTNDTTIKENKND
jgi:hypothetical protein